MAQELRITADALAGVERATEAAMATAAAHANALIALAEAAKSWHHAEDCEVHALNALPGRSGSRRDGGAGRDGGTNALPLASMLNGFANFMGLESTLQSAQPDLLLLLLLEIVRFERRTLIEAQEVCLRRAALQAKFVAVRAAIRKVGKPQPRETERYHALQKELDTMNKALLYLELPRLAEQRLA
eukprot:5083331-Prymnesium_polylepis.1